MTVSSVAVFPPGFRVTDADDNPISGATIEFYGAATTTPKTVYSDADLTVAIGTSMTTDAGGYPTSGGNKVLVYTNQAPYKIVIKDAGGSAIITHDNVKGAVEGSSSTSSSTGTTGYGMAVGDVKLSLSASPDAGFVRLTESTQNLLKADYPELNAWAAAQTYPWGSTSTTFGIPPAAGYFLRFAASTSAIDPSGPRTPGSTQADSYLNHSHTLTPGTITVPNNVIPRDGWTTGGTSSGTYVVPGVSVTAGRLLVGSGNAESVESLESIQGAGANITLATSAQTVSGAASAASTTGNAVETRAKNVAMYADMLARPSQVAESIVGASAFSYTYITSTTATDATAGKLGFNNSTIASATTFNINETDRYSASLAAIFASLRSGSIFLITKVGSPANSIRFTISATFTDNGTYDSVAITNVTATGTFADGDRVNVVALPAGPAGSVGTSGSSLIKGDGFGGIASATAGTDYTALAFKTIAVSGQSDVVADSASDTLTLAAGTGVTITTNAGTDTVTIACSGTWAGLSGTAFGSYNLTLPTLSAAATVAILEQAQTFTAAQTIKRDGIGATSTDALLLRNTTAAAAGAQQYSPRSVWEGQGWKTNATAASQAVAFMAETRPVQGTANPTGNWYLASSVNGGAYSDMIGVKSDGTLWASNAVFVGTSFSSYGAALYPSGLFLASNASLSWQNSTNISGSSTDVALYRGAANTLDLRNGGTSGTPVPQAFNVMNFGTITDGEWGYAKWVSNVFRIGTDKASTGTTRNLAIDIGGVSQLDYGVTTASTWTLPSANLKVVGSITGNSHILTTSWTGYLGWVSGTKIGINNTDGNLLFLNNAGTDFGRIMLGGTTSSFPAIKRSTTDIQVRLADDSGYAGLQLGTASSALKVGTHSAIAAETVTGYITIKDSAGTDRKIAVVS